jgi:hypothetical protein
MTTNLDVIANIKVRPTFKNTLSDGTEVSDALIGDFLVNSTLSNGTGASKAQVVYHARRSLFTTTSETLDLAGSLVSAFGVVTFTKIKGLFIKVNTATTGYRLEIGGAAANGFITAFGASTDTIIAQASGVLVLWAPIDGYNVTAATGDLLKINNPSGGTVSYDIALIGEGSVA